MIAKINNYIFKAFLKSFLIVVGSASVIISIVIISQELSGMPEITKVESTTIISASLLGMYRFMAVFFVSMTASLMIMNFSRTSQYAIMLTSGMSVMKIFKIPLIFTLFSGIIMIFVLKNLEIKLTEKSQVIIEKSKVGKSIKINLKDIDKDTNVLIINADYKYNKNIILTNVVITKQVNYNVFELIKSEEAEFLLNKTWLLKNVHILNNNTKSLYKYDKLILESGLTTENLLKQIDSSTKVLAGSSKQYTLYQLYDLLVGDSISNEARSVLKMQLWSNLSLPLKMICALLIVPIVIGNRAVTRNGLKLNAIFMPQIAIGACTYFLSFLDKIAIGTNKYEFTLCFLPYISFLCIILIILNKKNYT